MAEWMQFERKTMNRNQLARRIPSNRIPKNKTTYKCPKSKRNELITNLTHRYVRAIFVLLKQMNRNSEDMELTFPTSRATCLSAAWCKKASGWGCLTPAASRTRQRPPTGWTPEPARPRPTRASECSRRCRGFPAASCRDKKNKFQKNEILL